mmetsp:Transcript_15161/g.33902  ORF Transcript_15161/g.33902 Transcript_15161/m.33902 type:complete len:333 (+) Transcript_15161:449-1447(+)
MLPSTCRDPSPRSAEAVSTPPRRVRTPTPAEQGCESGNRRALALPLHLLAYQLAQLGSIVLPLESEELLHLDALVLHRLLEDIPDLLERGGVRLLVLRLAEPRHGLLALVLLRLRLEDLETDPVDLEGHLAIPGRRHLLMHPLTGRADDGLDDAQEKHEVGAHHVRHREQIERQHDRRVAVLHQHFAECKDVIHKTLPDDPAVGFSHHGDERIHDHQWYKQQEGRVYDRPNNGCVGTREAFPVAASIERHPQKQHDTPPHARQPHIELAAIPLEVVKALVVEAVEGPIVRVLIAVQYKERRAERSDSDQQEDQPLQDVLDHHAQHVHKRTGV